METWKLQKKDVKNALLEFAKTLPENGVAHSTITTSSRSDIDKLPESISRDINTDRHSLVTLTFSNWRITAGPLFQDSLLSTEVFVSASDINYNRPVLVESSRIDERCQSTVDKAPYSSHNYRRHDPLPDDIAALVYQSARIGPVISLFADDIADNTDMDWSDIYKLCRIITTRNAESDEECHVPLLMVTGGQSGSEFSTETKNGSVKQLALHECKLQNSFHQLKLIGKSALCIADSTAIAVDAIRLSTPFSFLSRPPPGWKCLQDCVLRYTHHGDKFQLVREQRIAFLSILNTRTEHCCVVNHTNALVKLLKNTLENTLENTNGSISDNLKSEGSIHDGVTNGSDVSSMQNCPLTDILSSQELILSGLHSYSPKPQTQKILSTRITASKRKYQKFRESPRRFLVDSKHWPFKPARQHR